MGRGNLYFWYFKLKEISIICNSSYVSRLNLHIIKTLLPNVIYPNTINYIKNYIKNDVTFLTHKINIYWIISPEILIFFIFFLLYLSYLSLPMSYILHFCFNQLTYSSSMSFSMSYFCFLFQSIKFIPEAQNHRIWPQFNYYIYNTRYNIILLVIIVLNYKNIKCICNFLF